MFKLLYFSMDQTFSEVDPNRPDSISQLDFLSKVAERNHKFDKRKGNRAPGTETWQHLPGLRTPNPFRTRSGRKTAGSDLIRKFGAKSGVRPRFKITMNLNAVVSRERFRTGGVWTGRWQEVRPGSTAPTGLWVGRSPRTWRQSCSQCEHLHPSFVWCTTELLGMVGPDWMDICCWFKAPQMDSALAPKPNTVPWKQLMERTGTGGGLDVTWRLELSLNKTPSHRMHLLWIWA